MDIIGRIKALKRPARRTITVSLADRRIADYERQLAFLEPKVSSGKKTTNN